MEWEYQLGDAVRAEMDPDLELPEDAIYYVEYHIPEGYVLFYPERDERYEVHMSMILPCTTE